MTGWLHIGHPDYPYEEVMTDTPGTPLTPEPLTEAEAECTHEDERGSTIMLATRDRYECIVCGTRFRLVRSVDGERVDPADHDHHFDTRCPVCVYLAGWREDRERRERVDPPCPNPECTSDQRAVRYHGCRDVWHTAPRERVDPDPVTPLQKLAAALHALNIPTWDYGRMRDLHDPSDQTGCWDLHLEQAERILAEWSDPSVKGPSDE